MTIHFYIHVCQTGVIIGTIGNNVGMTGMYVCDGTSTFNFLDMWTIATTSH